MNIKETWLKWLGKPSNCEFDHVLTLIKKYDYTEFDCELYSQPNGVGTSQRLMMLFPKNITSPVPCVVIPFYFPEAMLGEDPETGEALENYSKIRMMYDLVRRGYAVSCADAFYITYIPENKPDDGFNAWHFSAVKLRADHPQWTGMGKLVFDTQLMIDAMAADSRVDESRIGIAGHSLGGKMAMYTGCLDERIKVILASDLGIGWDQTNWNDIWYWGEKVDALKMAGLEHSSLLSAAAPKPFMLLAGEFDNEDSRAMMNRAAGYEGHEDNLQIINHATGHRPPTDVLEKGYDFLDKWLKD